MEDFFQKIVARQALVVKKTFLDEETSSAFIRSANFGLDLEKLNKVISSRPEAELFAFAICEYQHALHAAAGGLYRHAFISLRLFLELSFASIYFSSREILLRKWINQSSDIVWSSLIDENTGVFSEEFISAFNPELTSLGRQYNTLSVRIYRQCSEFVHGNLRTHRISSKSLNFDKAAAIDWLKSVETIRLCLLVAFVIRYIGFLNKSEKLIIEPVITENLGHIPSIRKFYEE